MLSRSPQFPPHGRILNFEDAAVAADRLEETDAWNAAEMIKANPDAPQLPVRRAALRAGKTLYMAVPRLREEECFLELDPVEIDGIDHATTVHERQVRESVPTDAHDVPLDRVVTSERAVGTGRSKPSGIDWDAMGASTIAEIPILERLRR